MRYEGDNAARNSGGALEWTSMQVFCWDKEAKGKEVHFQAAPSHAEKLYASYQGIIIDYT